MLGSIGRHIFLPKLWPRRQHRMTDPNPRMKTRLKAHHFPPALPQGHKQRARRAGDALSEPRRRPAGGHPWRSSGDIGVDGGVVWRAPIGPRKCWWRLPPLNLQQCTRLAAWIAALPESDFTAKLLLENLPAGQEIFYRVKFRDLSHPNISGEAVTGRFRTAPTERRDVQLRMGRRRRRTGLGHQSRRRRHGELCRHAQAPPGFPDFIPATPSMPTASSLQR